MCEATKSILRTKATMIWSIVLPFVGRAPAVTVIWLQRSLPWCRGMLGFVLQTSTFNCRSLKQWGDWGNRFSQGERFVTETELGQIDGIIPLAALVGQYKSLCSWAIKKMSGSGLKTLWLWTFLFSSQATQIWHLERTGPSKQKQQSSL